MKRKIIPLLLIASLLGTPAPTFAMMGGGAEMAKFMLMMMEMFSWMMGGNRNMGNMPYGGFGGLPTGMGSFPGSMGGLNPYSMAGLGALTGTGMPYGNPALMGLPGIGGLGSSPYGNTNNLYGSQYQQGLYNYYNNPYYGYSAYRRPDPRHRAQNEAGKRSEQPTRVIVQPVIIQPPSQENRPVIIQQPYQASQSGNMQPRTQTMAAATRPSPQNKKPDSLYPDQLDRNQYAPSVIAQPPVRINIPTQQDHASLDPGISNNDYPPQSYWQKEANPGNNEGWTPEPYRPDIKPSQQSLAGEWLGINGEYLVFEGDHFRMTDNKKLTEGSYVLKNGIMKAKLRDTDKPTYMQYSLQDGYLIFRTEDDQRMMFRRMKN